MSFIQLKSVATHEDATPGKSGHRSELLWAPEKQKQKKNTEGLRGGAPRGAEATPPTTRCCHISKTRNSILTTRALSVITRSGFSASTTAGHSLSCRLQNLHRVRHVLSGTGESTWRMIQRDSISSTWRGTKVDLRLKYRRKYWQQRG
jgi:hypothetical protein